VLMHLSFNAFSLGLTIFPFAGELFMYLINGWFFPAVSLWLAISIWVWGKGRVVKSQGAVNQVSSFEFKTTNEVDN
jgi:hypothetical protein